MLATFPDGEQGGSKLGPDAVGEAPVVRRFSTVPANGSLASSPSGVPAVRPHGAAANRGAAPTDDGDDELEARLARMEASLAKAETDAAQAARQATQTAEMLQALYQHTQMLTNTLGQLIHLVQAMPGAGAMQAHHCPACGAQGTLTVPLKCAACGETAPVRASGQR
ncbi:MAG: hypothetical protein FJ318_03610 [SAR202 cluster bacterium]|nr:hypothetical protein [SAR202 cluster bacterium]